MHHIPFQNWFILNLQDNLTNESKRLQAERSWAHKFRHSLLNDPFTWVIPKQLAKTHPRNYNRLAFIRHNNIQNKKLIISFLQNKHKSKLPINSLLTLYQAASIAKVRPSVKTQIYRLIQKFDFHNSIRCDYYITLPSNILFNRKFTLQFCKTILFKYLDKDLAFFILKRLKISFSPTFTIKSIVNNSKSFIEKIDLTKPFTQSSITCSCNLYHNFSKPKSPHICIKPSDISNQHATLKFLLFLNAKNPVLSNAASHFFKSIDAFSKFFKQFSIHLNTDELNRFAHYNNQQQLNRIHPIPYKFIKNTLSNYPNLVFSNLDKNENSWVIMCPKLYTQMYHDHFAFNSNIYALSKFSQTQFSTFLKTKAISYSIHKIAPLKVNHKINRAYLLKKSKDLSRVRPIVSYFFFIGHSAGKIISRTLNVLITKISKIWTSMNLHKTNDFINKINKINKSNTWTPNSFTFLEFDVKEQYTNLDRQDVLVSLLQLMKTIFQHLKKQHVSISKKKIFKSKDCLGNKKSSKFYTVHFSQIIDYVKFEMKTSHFFVGKTLVQQEAGLPMGALTSAALAVIFCMYRENTNQNLWKKFPCKFIFCRFRDDIRGIINMHMNPREIKAVHQNLQSIYGKDLISKLEASSHSSCNFIGTFLLHIHNRFVLFYTNKNFPFNTDLSSVDICSTKTRFPDYYAEWPSSILRAVVYSSFFQALTISSEPIAFLISFALLSIEFLSKGYRFHWLTDAINKLNIHYQKTCIHILKHIKCTFHLPPPQHHKTPYIPVKRNKPTFP